MKDIFLGDRVYKIFGAIILTFVAGNFIPVMYWIALGLLILLVVLLLIDYITLIRAAANLTASRKVIKRLSLGDVQHINYHLQNDSNLNLSLEVVDELPFQFQYREEVSKTTIQKNDVKNLEFEIMPTERGDYLFGKLFLYISNPLLRLILLRKKVDSEFNTKVYPSIIQMKKYALFVMYRAAHMYGIRKIRTIGENDEFEHIRNYQMGDNEKSINWKATSRAGELLVNQFQDTRSQQVFCVIDKGRAMEMPFNSLSLLDHAINSALVISNIVLQKYDKAGLITYCNKIDAMIKAESGSKQLELILESLYAQETAFKESNFELLYLTMRKKISKRSIVFLYTNFESKSDLERNLQYIRLLAKQHLLIIILFINTELYKKSEMDVHDLSGIYEKTIAQSILSEKEDMVKELNNVGIQTILTKPEDLSINVINKYLEIKAKRMK